MLLESPLLIKRLDEYARNESMMNLMKVVRL